MCINLNSNNNDIKIKNDEKGYKSLVIVNLCKININIRLGILN